VDEYTAALENKVKNIHIMQAMEGVDNRRSDPSPKNFETYLPIQKIGLQHPQMAMGTSRKGTTMASQNYPPRYMHATDVVVSSY
jgi:hypothetical protein